MTQKLFSIITAVYNGGPKLEKTIKSVLSQDEELFEFIIVDGASTDDTLSIIEEYADQIKLISEEDEGVYDAMNKGIDLAVGKYLYFLGAGDSLRPGILAKVAPMMPSGELWFVYGNTYMVNRGIIYDGEFPKERLKTDNIAHQSIFYERTIFDVAGRFDLRFRVLADHAFNLKCFWNDKIQKKYIPYVIANFEGGGLSDDERDLAFEQEYAELRSIGR